MLAPAQLDETALAAPAPYFRRMWIVLAALLILILLVAVPPYININRFQRRITTSISESLGRPVHLDHVSLNLLPIPGFTLERFVVSEDPRFGSEPTIRADKVRVSLRVSTLWRRRIEFSTISLTDPSINLVHTAQGEWNLDSILLQAAHIDAAPTAQRAAGPAPRFPYIEATGARVNLKLDVVKTPFSLTEADLALWLPDPHTWHFRITARPARTDVPVGYTGLLHLDGTLGRAATLSQIPIDLHAEWRTAPLGEMSRILLGRDAGWRGDMTLSASLLGSVGSNEIHTRLHVADARRADFVPVNMLSMTTECTATLTNAFHTITAGQCTIPSAPGAPTFTGSLPDIRQPQDASFQVILPLTPANGATILLQTLSARISPRLQLGGTITGSMTYGALSPAGQAAPRLTGSVLYRNGSLLTGPEKTALIPLGDLVFLPAVGQAVQPAQRTRPSPAQATEAQPAIWMRPVTLPLGGRDPATLEGRFDRHGYTLRLAGNVSPERLATLAQAIPQLGDGLQDALPPESTAPMLHLDLTSTRAWGGLQTWQDTAPHPPAPVRQRRKRAASR